MRKKYHERFNRKIKKYELKISIIYISKISFISLRPLYDVESRVIGVIDMFPLEIEFTSVPFGAFS